MNNLDHVMFTRLPKATFAILKKRAKDERLGIATYVRMLITNHLGVPSEFKIVSENEMPKKRKRKSA